MRSTLVAVLLVVLAHACQARPEPRSLAFVIPAATKQQLKPGTTGAAPADMTPGSTSGVTQGSASTIVFNTNIYYVDDGHLLKAAGGSTMSGLKVAGTDGGQQQAAAAGVAVPAAAVAAAKPGQQQAGPMPVPSNPGKIEAAGNGNTIVYLNWNFDDTSYAGHHDPSFGAPAPAPAAVAAEAAKKRTNKGK